jgi:hypothetical protein
MPDSTDRAASSGPSPDERSYWSPTDSPGEMAGGDSGEDTVRHAGTRRTNLNPGGVETTYRRRLADEEMVQRVGGRRRIRPEVVLAIAGSVFVVAALLKPWPNPLPASRPSPIAAASPTAAVTIGPSPIDNTDVTVIQFGVPDNLVQRWSAVDWSGLRTTDPHSGWGFAAAMMPSVGEGPAIIEGPAGPGTILPMTSWVAAGSPPSNATLPVVGGQNVYAIAVTWPDGLNVTSVTFQYVGGSGREPYLPPPGFPPFTQVSPLPADRVASPAAATQSDPAAASPALAGHLAIRSGQFWIPPAEVSGNALSSSTVPTAWKSLPWPWPDGTYRVTVVSQTGPVTIVLRLQQAA